MRNVIYYYLKRLYQTESFGVQNDGGESYHPDPGKNLSIAFNL